MPTTAETFSVRLPDGLKAEVESLARQYKRSRSFIIKEAVEAYVEDRREYLKVGLVCGAVKLSRRGALVAASSAALIIAASSAALFLRRGEAARGIVLSESATVRLSPFEKAESLGTPGPGRIVRLGAKSGDFQYIEVPGVSLQGWLASKDVAAILP